MSESELYLFKFSDLLSPDVACGLYLSTSKLKDVYGKYDIPKNLSLGDIAVTNKDPMKALEYAKLFPDEASHKLTRVVLPMVEQRARKFYNTDVAVVISLIRDYMWNREIDISKLKDMSLSLVTLNGAENIELVNSKIAPLYMLAKSIWDTELRTIEGIIITASYMLDNSDSGTIKKTRDSLLENICLIFPPVKERYSSPEEEAFYSAVIRNKSNWLLKLLRFKRKDGKSFEFKWGSLEPEWGFSFKVLEFDREHRDDDDSSTWFLSFTFIFGRFWINLPIWLPRHNFSELGQDSIRTWGFSINDEGNSYVHLSFGKRYKYIDLPWSLSHIRTEHLMKDGSWQSRPSWDAVELTCDEFEDLIAKETHSIMYMLKSGEKQYRLATICIREMEWRRKWIKIFPIFRRIVRSIDVKFSDEVGERSGSWKGGTIGCSYEMKHHEYPKETLRRMMEDRKF